MKIRISFFVLATLSILPTLADSTTENPVITIGNPTETHSPRQGSEERKQEERELREKFEKGERKYYDKRIANLEKNIQNMLANIYLSGFKKMELDVALALLRKAATSKDTDVKKFAYKEAFDISIRALP
ncbi:uncharacterized protein LOC129252941 [Anastrepha obliqua]|uniref:uncharacterized protein LOC129252941 n=1 Tax=Anastrepha obliqua TaxID=95512 RepID=UPI002409C621|nr:uncharacterized protein LOC129252941 [Anastrepha obliqua]